ncbi:MAG: Calx-beta domain-containing protein [Thermoguttaceae bacterium]
MEPLEPRKLLTAVINVQPMTVTAGHVGDLQVTIDGEISAPQTVNLSVVDGTAVQGSDYFVPPADATLTFQPGQTVPDLASIFTVIDTTATANKTFTAVISNPTGDLTLGNSSQAACTIVEPGPGAQIQAGLPTKPTGMGVHPLVSSPSLTLTGPGSVNEGSQAAFLVTLSQPTSAAVSVSYKTLNGTASAGVNYTSTSGTGVIPAGSSTAWIYVSTIDDHIYETNEGYFWLDLTSASGASLPSVPSVSAWIQNIDPLPSVALSGPGTVLEGNNAASFQISLIPDRSNTPITVYYKTQNINASPGYNYTAQNSFVVIPAYGSTAWVTVPTFDNPVNETNGEYFMLDLTSATGANMGALCASATVTNELFYDGANNGNLGIGPWAIGSINGATLSSWPALYNAEFPSISGSETLNVPSNFSVNTLHFLGGSYTYTLTGGSITAGSAGLTIDVVQGGTAVINSAIGGSGGLTKIDSGALALTGTNTYTNGTIVNGGTLIVGATSALGNSPAALVVNTGGTLDLDGNNLAVTTLNGGGTIQNSLTSGGTLTDDTVTTDVFSGIIQNGPNGSGTVALTMAGSGMLTLSGGDTYSGGTTVSQGKLRLGSEGAFPLGTNVTVNGPGTLDLGGFDATAGGLSGSGTVDVTGGGTSTLMVGYGNAASTFGGTIQDTGGTLSLAKIGSGTLTLSGNNSYMGDTFVDDGVLAVTSTGSISNSTVTVDGGTLSNRGSITQPIENSNLLSNLQLTSEQINAGYTLVPYPNEVYAGNVATLSANVNLKNTPFTIIVDWGEGQPETDDYCESTQSSTPIEINHYYPDPATETPMTDYSVTVTVETATNTAAYHTTATYISVAPAFVGVGFTGGIGIQWTNSGASYTATFTTEVFDPGIADALTYSWSGTANGSGATQVQTGANSTFVLSNITSSFLISLTATNDDDVSTTISFGSSTLGKNSPLPPVITPTLSITEADDDWEKPGEVVAGSNANFQVTLQPPQGAPDDWRQTTVTVFCTATDGSATADEDYTALDQTTPVRGPQELWFIPGVDGPLAITAATFNDPAQTSAATFTAVLSNPCMCLGDCTLSPASATATILQADLDADSGNESYTGRPDHTANEARIQNETPGKFIAVQEMNSSNNPVTGSHFVPLDLLLAGFTGSPNVELIRTGTAKLTLWEGDVSTANNTAVAFDTVYTEAQLGISVGTYRHFFVEATSFGVATISLSVYDAYTGQYNIVDSVLFTALDENVTCLECTYGFTVGPTGIAELEDNSLGNGNGVYMNSGSPGSTQIGQPPYLVLAGNAVAILQNDQIDIWDRIDNSQTGLVPRDPGAQGTLEHNGGDTGGNYVETDLDDAAQWTFAAPDNPFTPADYGLLTSETDAYGNPTNDYYFAGTDQLASQISTVGPAVGGNPCEQQIAYTYVGGVVTSETVTLGYANGVSTGTPPPTPVQGASNLYWHITETVGSADFVYYDGGPSDPGGNAGDLELVQTFDAGNQSTGATYYRYYTSGSDDNDVEYVLNPDSVARAMAANGYGSDYADLNNLTQGSSGAVSDIGTYADNYVTYDPGTSLVYSNAVQGSDTTDYTSTANASGPPYGFNTWSNEQVASQPDGSTTTTFYNYEGDVLLSDVTDADGNQFVTYNRYDSNGNLVLTAEPSAFIPNGGYYSTSYADLVDYSAANGSPYLNQNSGLFEVNTYYASTTATTSTPGGVADWAYQTAVAQGQNQANIAIGASGGPILQSSTNYIAATDSTDGTTTYYTNQSIQYPTTGPGTIVNYNQAVLSPAPPATTWTLGSGSDNGYNSYYWAASGSGSATATWTASGLTQGEQYEVLVTWISGLTGEATNAPFTVYDGSTAGTTLLQTTINEAQVPDSGGIWQNLGAFTVNSGTVTVRLTNAANGSVVADAVLVVPVRATTYTYQFNTSSASGPAIEVETTTQPAICNGQSGTPDQHGSGIQAQSEDVYNSLGQLVWSKDANGSISYTAYDPATGAVVQRIQDVNLSGNTGDAQFQADLALLTNYGLNWTTPANGGQNLLTTYLVDSQGRTIREQDPDGDVTCTVYNDADQEVLTYPGWHQDPVSGSWETTGPVQLSRTDLTGTYTESLTYGWTGTGTNALPTTTITTNGVQYTIPAGTESPASQYAIIQSLSRSLLNASGQVTASLDYTSMPSSGYAVSPAAIGSLGTNYLETTYSYDALGRQISTVAPDGTVDDTLYDANGNVTQEWKGTNDGGVANFDAWVANNPSAVIDTTGGVYMYKVSGSTYNADGDLIESDQYIDPTGYLGPRTTYYQYDWQDRQIGTLGPVTALVPDGVATIDTLDNLGEVTMTQMYAEATMSGGVISYTTADLRAQTVNEYDPDGNVYESQTFNVAPEGSTSPGAVGDYLPTDTWYDSDGNVLATRSGLGPIEKSVYNGGGELVATYACAETTATGSLSYAQATTLQTGQGGDTVVQQTQAWYDADGNTIATANYQRFPSDTTDTGALTAANSYVTASVSFYDAAGRDIEDVNYGREDTGSGQTHYFFNGSTGALIQNSDGNPSAAEGTPPLPNSSSNYVVSETVYNDTSATGPIVQTIDNAGVITQTQSDLMGRTIRTIQNYVAGGLTTYGNLENTDTAEDITTDSLYDSSGRLAATVAYDATGSGNVQAQTTAYLYESPLDPSLQTNEIEPDSTDVPAAVSVSLSQTNGVATATGANSYLPGDWVLIQGASDAYNGWFRVASATASQFTYQLPAGASPSASSGTAQALVAWNSVTSLTWNSANDTATAVVANNYATGEWVSIQGANQSQFNGWFLITSANSTQFTFALSSATVSTASGTIRVRIMNDQTQTTYDLAGEPFTSTDQRGVAHEYTYNSDGQQTQDNVTSFGLSGQVDRTVNQIDTTYDDMDRVYQVTSWGNLSGSESILNQVQYACDGWGNLIQEWQSNSGSVNTSTTPSVQYTYADGANGTGIAEYLRLTQTMYPNYGKSTVNYNYPAGVDSIMSLLGSITDGSGNVEAAYSYLGADTIATENYQQAQVKLDYSANNFAAWDRFGRVLDQVWVGYGSGNSGTLDGYQYAYNATGDRTSQANQTNNALNETFNYDSLDRLTSWSLNGTRQEAWNLDALGNDLNTGSYDASNEETPKSGSSGYDLAGNMTTLLSGDTAIYDAWNRLVEVKSGSTILEECAYDGANRRIQVSTNFNGGTPGTVTNDYYSGQQLVESDITTNGVKSGYQYVWSPRYIDAPILRDTLNSSGNVVTALRVFYLGDANYNVTALVSASSGQVLERYSYTPYGVLTAYNSAWGSPSPTPSSTYGNAILYSGHQLDPAISLYYCRARFYDPALQRFVSQDPMGYAAGDMNVYRYCGDGPLNATDPTGEVILRFNRGATPDEIDALTKADEAVTKRLPAIIAEMEAYTSAVADAWATANQRSAVIAGAEIKMRNYQTNMLSVLKKIQARLTAGYFACVTHLAKDIAQTTYWPLLVTNWYTNIIDFDKDRYFELEPSLPMGNGTGFKKSQANVLLHELSHMAADTNDDNLNYIPAPRLPGNPTNVKDPKFNPSNAADDASFIQKFQENSVASVTQQWITPFVYVK